MKQRPFGVTVLAILAGIAAVLAAVHTLQSLGWLPLFFTPRDITLPGNIWYALMWALMTWIWIWVVQMLWRVEEQGWLFVAAISTLNLIFITLSALGAGSSFTDQSLAFIVNALMLIYVLLPGTKAAFGVGQPKM
jgi:hypothetical protein